MSEPFPSKFQHPSESIGFLLWRVTHLWQKKLQEALKSFDLTHVQFVLLAGTWWLEQQGERVSQSRLAEHSFTDRMMTSQVVRKLEDKQLVKRMPDIEDKRAYRLSTTKRGKNVLKQALPSVEEADGEFFQALGQNEKKFAHLLFSLTQSLQIQEESTEVSQIDFVKLSKDLLSKKSNQFTKVYFRLFPVWGVNFNEQNKPFFEATLQASTHVLNRPCLLTCAEILDHKIIDISHDTALHDKLTQDRVTIRSRQISGNFLIIALAFSAKEEDVVSQVDVLSSVLRLNFGNFLVWPNFYEFVIDVSSNNPSPSYPQRLNRFYLPEIDGPFIYQSNETIEDDIEGEFKALTHAGREKYELPLSIIEDATREQDLRKKVFLYYSAIEILMGSQGEKDIINSLKKAYDVTWEEAKQLIGEKFLVRKLATLRGNVIHKGYIPKSFPILERYLQILNLEIIDYKLNRPCRRLLDRFIKQYGVSWWKENFNRKNKMSKS